MQEITSVWQTTTSNHQLTIPSMWWLPVRKEGVLLKIFFNSWFADKPAVKIEKLSVNSETNLDSELICYVHGVPKPEVLWKKDGINIVSGKRHVLKNVNRTHILLIKNVQKEDFGVYTCYAKNRIGKTEVNLTLTAYPSTPVVQSHHHSHNKSIIAWVLESKSPITKYMLEFKKLKVSHLEFQFSKN